MVQQHHAHGMRSRLGGKHLGAEPRQPEARHHVGDDHHALTVDLAYPLRTVRGVGDGDQRIGMGMIDETIGQNGMQDSLH